MRKISIDAVLIVLFAALLAVCSYLLRPDALKVLPDESTQDMADENASFQTISIARAGELFANGQALFADARPAFAYDAGHIQGAVNLNPAVMDQWVPTIMDNYPIERPIITYCEGTQCTLSHELAEQLTALGYQEVYYLIDGWGQWQAQGLPVE